MVYNRGVEPKVDKDGTLHFLLKRSGRLIAFKRVGHASASLNASANWVGKWQRLLSALGKEAREAQSFAVENILSISALSTHTIHERTVNQTLFALIQKSPHAIQFLSIAYLRFKSERVIALISIEEPPALWYIILCINVICSSTVEGWEAFEGA